jgi:hypothetical protein
MLNVNIPHGTTKGLPSKIYTQKYHKVPCILKKVIKLLRIMIIGEA